MASINVMEIIKAEFAEAALRIQARLAGTDGAAVLKVSGKKGAAKEKKVSVRKGAPTVRGDFTKKLLEERKAEVEAFKAKMKEEQPEQKGAHLVFVSKYIEEHAEEYAAFKSAWEVAHPKPEKGAPAASDSASEAGSDSGSEAPAPAEGGEKKKRVLSEEHKAKMQAARKAKKAEKEAAKAAEEAAAKAEGEEGEEAAPAAAAAEPPKPAKKAPKKAAKAEEAAPTPAPAPVAAPPAEAEAEDDEEGPEFQSFLLGKTKYFRLGNRRPDGSVIWATGDLWENNKGARGDYVGLLGEDGAIDTSAEEPDLE